MTVTRIWDPENKNRVLLASALGAAAITLTISIVASDWLVVLYLAPLLFAVPFLNRTVLLCSALVCAALRGWFVVRHWDSEGFAQLTLAFAALAGPSFLVYQTLIERRRAADQERLLKGAYEERRMLVESSPAAVVTVSKDGQILIANEAARKLLGLQNEESSPGELITKYVPVLQQVLKTPKTASFVRTMVEGSARNSSGEPFYVQMWISSYDAGSGPRIAVIFSDATESLRDREELGLRQLLTSSQIVAGAVSHEIRNLSAAASVLHGNLLKRLTLSNDPDFNALGTLIHSLRNIASSEIPSYEDQVSGVEVSGLLDELRIIVANTFKDDQIELVWETADQLPRVRADRPALLQVLLNLMQNAGRAVQGRSNRSVRITSYTLEGSVIISVTDSGPGIANPERTFQPFQPGATSSGLGLYVSRAIVRTFGGELAYDNRVTGGCFVVHLPALSGVR